MEWFPHPLPAYTRHWTTFICCGWAHGSIIMPLPTYVSTQMLEVPWNSPSLLGDKGWHCEVVEALTQHGMVPTSPPNIWKVFDNFHILWMGTAILEPSSCDYHYMMCSPRLGCAFRRNSGGFRRNSDTRHRHVPFRPGTGTGMCYNTNLDIPVYSGWYLSTRFLQVENARTYSK
jgi:hypothetical protein